jgi:LuxR family transcriptional regulator, maltose regulon positive regulatory protein
MPAWAGERPCRATVARRMLLGMPTALVDAPTAHVDDLLGQLCAHRPPLRARVHRARLVEPLKRADGPGTVALIAPAGYGKTTLLCEWCAHDPRPFAWVTLDRRHDDQGFLLRSITRALDEFDGAPARVLVLDDVHVLSSAGARETIARIASHPPAGITIALASRTSLPLPLARLRAQGLLRELLAPELALRRSEAAALLRCANVSLEREEIDALLRRTEGWPALLALAVQSLRDEPSPGRAATRFSGGDRLIADFVREQVLDGLGADERRFVVHTSVLDVVTAPLCNAVLGRTDAAAALTALQDANFPLVALDRAGEHFRHHRVVGDVLRAELRGGEPEAEARLHRRAAAWHAETGDRERALRHALAAGDVERGGELVWSGAACAVAAGSGATVERWLTRFTADQVSQHPRLALTAAGVHLAAGRGDVAEHWLRAAAARVHEGELAGVVGALRAAVGHQGLARMQRDAEAASRQLADESPYQALCCLVAGVAAHLRGARGVARDLLEDGARRAIVAAPQIQALCLAQLALLALDEDDHERANQLIARSRSQVTRLRLDGCSTCALVLAVAALVRARRGRVDAATEDLHAALPLAEQLTDFAPWHDAEVKIVLARAALRLSDANLARSLLADARRAAARTGDAGVLHEWLDAAEADLAVYAGAVCSLPVSLTPAELRILHLLPTHLSFREMGQRMRVSANTVKTQANAIYRKLDVRSRSDAVVRARELGLLELT